MADRDSDLQAALRNLWAVILEELRIPILVDFINRTVFGRPDNVRKGGEDG